MKKYYLAKDFGASSGRGIVGSIDKGKLSYEEIHRFPNLPVSVHGTLYWDVLSLYRELENVLLKAKDYAVVSLSVDTWGVDFGLLDSKGALLQNPVHYRDNRTEGAMERVFAKVSAGDIYRRTGIERLAFNTLYQLYVAIEKMPTMLAEIETFLLMPDLFNYFLTGKKFAELTITGTTQMLDAQTQDWDYPLLDLLGLNGLRLPEIIPPGTTVGPVLDSVCSRLDIGALNVVAGASHDTQSALVSVPAIEEHFLYLSSGTWSLLGTELDAPIINAESEQYNFTNEIAYGKKISFHKNIMGMWLIQECRRIWSELDFGEMAQMALEAESLSYVFDVDDPRLNKPENMVEAITGLLEGKYGTAVSDQATIIRSVYESLALKYRWVAEQVEKITGQSYDRLYVIGGGCQNAVLNQFIANCLGRTVVAGPVEATAIGNLLVQAIASEELGSLHEARSVVLASEDVSVFEPSRDRRERNAWDAAYEEFVRIYVS